jgi:hypothetical protein
MKITQRPMLTTVLYGLSCGVTFIPLITALSSVLYWPMAFMLTIWLYLAGYLALLAKWARATLGSILFPLLLLLVVVFWGSSSTAFILLALGTLSWVRSGIYFKGGTLKTLGSEAILCLGGGALVACFTPNSTITWAMAIWMFSLVQSLYFIFFRETGEVGRKEMKFDPFDQAKGKAEKILATLL